MSNTVILLIFKEYYEQLSMYNYRRDIVVVFLEREKVVMCEENLSRLSFNEFKLATNKTLGYDMLV